MNPQDSTRLMLARNAPAAATFSVGLSPDPNDRRGILVGPTSDGVAAALELRSAYDELETRILAPLDASQRADLIALLRTLVNAYESDGWSAPER